MLASLRRGRYGLLLALHILLLVARGKRPTEIAEFLLCARSSVYRIVDAYRAGGLGALCDEEGSVHAPLRTTVLVPWIRRSLLSLLGKGPAVFGWCRTAWSSGTLSIELKARHGLIASAETVRRWLHEIGYVWKRAKLVAKDDDPERVEKLARIRAIAEGLGAREALLFADEFDINLLPKVGYSWVPKGEKEKVMTPGQNEKQYGAVAVDFCRGTTVERTWFRKVGGLFIDLLKGIEARYPAFRFDRIYVVVDNVKIHSCNAVKQWLSTHPRIELVFLPTYCPEANPAERVIGDMHDKCTRNHKRKRLWDLIEDIKIHFAVNGPWKYKLSHIYYAAEVTKAVEKIRALQRMPAAA